MSRVSSAGRNNITRRINSNKYINHLITTYRFSVSESGYTRSVCPNCIINILRRELQDQPLDQNQDIETIIEHFNRGWAL